jgi:tape measure domain-containing protein
MSTEVGSLHYSLNLNTSSFDKALSGAKRSMQSLRNSFEVSAEASQRLATGLAATAAAISGVMFAGVKYSSELESLTVSLETVFGSTEKANEAMKQIKKTAQDSPFFDVKTLSQFVQVMGASGQAMEDAVKSGLRFGDVAAAFGKGNVELTRMGNTLSQVIGKGKADTVDFKELVNSGWVSIRNDVAKSMNISMAKFEEMVEAGSIGYEQISKAAEKFTGSAAKQSNGFNSIVQRMQETFLSFVGELSIDIGLFDALKNGLSSVTTFLENNKDTIKRVIIDGLNWIKENGNIVSAILIGALTPAFIALAGAITSTILPLVPFMAAGAAIAYLWENNKPLLGAIAAGFISIAVALAVTFTPALLAAAAAAWAAIAPMLLMAAPFIALGVAIGVATFFIIKNWDKFLAYLEGSGEKIRLRVYAIKDWFDSIPGWIKSALSVVTDAIFGPFKRAFDLIQNATSKVKDALSRLNPFHRESPSLVDWVKKGTGVIKSEYANLFTDIEGLTSNVRPSLVSAVAADSDSVNIQQPIRATVNAGAFMGTPADARQFARMMESEMAKIKVIGGRS